MTTDNAGLITKRELAKAVQVSGRTVENWMKAKTIPYFKIGKSVRFNLQSVMSALEKFTIEPAK